MPNIRRREYDSGDYVFPKRWHHLRDSTSLDDASLCVKDDFVKHYLCYRSTFQWKPCVDGGKEGVLSVWAVIQKGDRDDRELRDDVVRYARSIWNIERFIFAPADQGTNGLLTANFHTRLKERPSVEECERFYRLLKGLDDIQP